jgi:hypothetical protein
VVYPSADLDARISELTADAEALFDKPDLQKHGVRCFGFLPLSSFPDTLLCAQYDLRAVIIHDGLLGRNHVYSYTKDEKEKWWKILDYQVSQVRSPGPLCPS